MLAHQEQTHLTSLGWFYTRWNSPDENLCSSACNKVHLFSRKSLLRSAAPPASFLRQSALNIKVYIFVWRVRKVARHWDANFTAPLYLPKAPEQSTTSSASVHLHYYIYPRRVSVRALERERIDLEIWSLRFSSTINNFGIFENYLCCHGFVINLYELRAKIINYEK